jgi:nicotinate dehydrogenase subunit B
MRHPERPPAVPAPATAAVPNARLADWLRIEADDSVSVFTGKVELGQGVLTALRQMAAEELCLPFDRVHLVSGNTDVSPDEGYTAGSRSVQVSGTSIRVACADALRLLQEAASARLSGSEVEPTFTGAFRTPTGTAELRYGELARTIDWTAPVSSAAATTLRQSHRWIGRSIPRTDLPAKIRGAAFIHDLAFDGMLHARVLRPPARFARLVSIDESALRLSAGVTAVVRDGSFVGVLAEREEHAVAAVALAARHSRWQDERGSPVAFAAIDVEPPAQEAPNADPFEGGESLLLRTQQTGSATAGGGRLLRAQYSRPFIAHASIGPSCALARFDRDAGLTVWSHTQGVFQLRGDIARALGMPAAKVRVEHVQGSGCYGHNGADDVAFDAALLARATPGRVVRVQWSREDELGWSPVGSAMRTQIEARLDGQGHVLDWQLEVHSGSHMNRPGSAKDGVRLLGAGHLAEPAPLGTPIDTALEQGGGGDRNALAEYAFASQQVRYRFYPTMPLRTSSLRGLGAFENVFAIESFMDEAAEAAGIDAIEFRLRHLADPRSRAVLAAARAMTSAALADNPSPAGRAIGCGYARYKNIAAYCAIFVELSVETEVRLHRIWCAVDAGLVINPDGLANQIEGGILQAASWTLKEQVAWQAGRITSIDWARYPILRFSEVPEIEVQLMDGAGNPALGVGEAAHGPTAGAIANAMTRALGIRPRDLPFTRERLVALIERS